MSQEVFHDYQLNLENTDNLNSSLLGGRYSNFLGSGENLTWGDLTFYGGT